MLHHVEIYVSDLDVSFEFWSAILSRIGYATADRWEDGFTLKDGDNAYLTFVQRSEKYANLSYHRCGVGLNHIAFKLADKEIIHSLREYCLDNNITCLYDDRYPYANGTKDYFALFIEDPDRIKVEFVAA